MLLIDKEKTVIAGEALVVITELAAVLDRLVYEITEKKASGTIQYDHVIKKFMSLVAEVRDVRGDETDLNPHELIASGRLTKLFPEDFFNLSDNGLFRDSSESKNISSDDASNALKKAMDKLAQAKTLKTKKKKED